MVLQRGPQKGNCGQSLRSPVISRWQTGQRSCNIGNSLAGLGRFFPRPLLLRPILRRRTRPAGVRGRRNCRLCRLLLGLGGALVRLAAVVRLVEAGALEEDGRPGAEGAAQLQLAARRTLPQGGVLERLHLVEDVVAGLAAILVRGHGGQLSFFFSSSGGTTATATLAGRRTRSWIVYPCSRTLTTVKGECSLLGCWRTAWCRFGLKGCPWASMGLTPLRFNTSCSWVRT